MPVYLSGFTTTAEGESVNLAWNSESVNNITGFRVERSEDGKAFSVLEKVKPVEGTNSYFLTDPNPTRGMNYYRIYLERKGGFYFGENPCSETLVVYSDEEFNATVLSPNGTLIRQELVQSGEHSIQVSDLEPGLYYLRNDFSQEIKKFMVIR
jgi:hypothetical protein